MNKPEPDSTSNKSRSPLRFSALKPSFVRSKDVVLSLPQLTSKFIDNFLQTFKSPYLASKAYRFLARQIANDLGPIDDPKLIVFSSASTAESSNQVLLMFSHFLQDELAAKILIVDATFTREGVSDLLKLQDAPGFTQLIQSTAVNLDTLIQQVGVNNISCLPSGLSESPAPSYIPPEKFDEIVQTIGKGFDFVILQQGHIASDTRYLSLAKKADLFLLHMEEQTTPIADFERAIDVLNEQTINSVRYLLSEP